MTDKVHTGSCLCGAVRIRATGAPNWVANCHCRDCQKGTGAAFATYAGFPRDKVEIAGDPASAVVRRETSPGVHRTFCGTCGSPISYESDKWADEIHLFTAMLDDVAELAPQVNVQMAEAMPWLHLGDDLPKFARFIGDDGDGQDGTS